jgi:thioredoxin 1
MMFTTLWAFAMCLVMGSVSAGGDVIEIRDQGQWERLLQKETLIGRPVVVDFFSNGCGPCRMIAPVYEQIASQYKGKVIFTKVNVQTTHIGIEIRSMPTFQFFLKGKKQHEFSGADEGGIRRTVQMLVKKAQKAKKVKEIADFKGFKKTLSMAGKLPVVAAFVSKTR